MIPSRDEVWLVNLDPTIGDEIRKTRPAVVMNDDGIGVLALRIVVPITRWQSRFSECEWIVRLNADTLNGLDKQSCADAFQFRSLSTQRFSRRLGRLVDADLSKIEEALIAVFGL